MPSHLTLIIISLHHGQELPVSSLEDARFPGPVLKEYMLHDIVAAFLAEHCIGDWQEYLRSDAATLQILDKVLLANAPEKLVLKLQLPFCDGQLCC